MSTRAWHSVFAQNGWKPHHSPAGRTHRSAPYGMQQNSPYSSNAFCHFPAPLANKRRTPWQHQRIHLRIMLPHHRRGRPMCLPAVGTPYSPKMDGNRTTPLPGGHIGPHPTACGKIAGIHPTLFVTFLPILANKRRTPWQHQRINSCITLSYHRERCKVAGIDPTLFVFFLPPLANKIRRNKKTGTASAVPVISHKWIFRTRPAPSSQWQPS